ncbi:toll-like receptor Tlr1.2 precursor [Strongylocentrotus purpuratus]|uniref:Toll-like receptor Tlr1.2 n=1 Tax=Strongylocentrotus purpuratus TaxID=7668 RepID=Q9BJD5_STRPU|nr:toll-like receptor Tlr1.2 precursor [Strongylocentrotus purpuratus]AAK25762.1 toll-like receptor Tlr1.2 [Strongylocentrotus purpuratus]|eukprot:NP_999671.1 toll-like receptor Tlr1.2 precursor [Strongylocentrotus purpuratus]
MAFIRQAPFLRCLPLVLLCILTPTLIQTIHQDAMLTSSMKCHYDAEQKEADCSDRGLDSIPQNLPDDIEELDLKFNKITFILSSSFMRYPLIQVLDFSSNDIRMIESASFYPLKELNRLDLPFNHNLVFPATDLFRWSRNLSILKLYGSNLKLLPNDTLKWSPSVESIYLRFNKLTFVNMSLCGRAKKISLAYNKIEHLTAESFIIGCQSDYIDLTGNPIKSVDPNVIASLRVRSLVLGEYPLTLEVLKDTFIGICRSEIVELTINGANFTVLPRDFFSPLRNCSPPVLKFTGNNLQSLSQNVFSNLTRLVELDLSHNEIQALSPYVFSNLTRLVELDLSFNEIQSLSPYVFSNLTRLVELDLSQNKIITVEPVFYQGMRGLKVLNLNFNQIKYINPNTDEWTLDLNELYLRSNSLTEISEFAFFGLRNLTLLDLSFNKDLIVLNITSSSKLTGIQTIALNFCNFCDMDIFQPVAPNLTTLFMNNMIAEMIMMAPGITFEDSQGLENLEIRNSGLSNFNIWDEILNTSLFDGLSNLITLDLSQNYFDFYFPDDFPARIFKQLSALQNLSLEACHISCLHPLAFTGLESLRVLNLSGNVIQQLNFDIFKMLDQVTIIDLHDNLLAYLDEQLFSNNPRLTTLLLSNNKLTLLNQKTFEPIESSLLSFDLSLNPIDCNCDLRWFRDWMSGHIDVIDKNRTICSSASLQPLREKPLLDFDPNKLCGLNIGLVVMTPLAGIFLGVIVAIFYHNRLQLKYKLFLLKLMVIGYKEMRDARDHNDYEFDLNIIFYEDDEEWVRQQLQPALEERLPQFQRNVFGDQDLILGMHYLDAVDYVVSHSYKTLILLSRAAVHDRWFMLKLRTAMDHVSDTQTEFVVVVFLEDFPDEDIPFLARLYLSDGRPYQHWTEDVGGHVFFWNALVKNLTINLRTNDFIPNE